MAPIDVAVDANLQVTFSEPVDVAGLVVRHLLRRERDPSGDRQWRPDDVHP